MLNPTSSKSILTENDSTPRLMIILTPETKPKIKLSEEMLREVVAEMVRKALFPQKTPTPTAAHERRLIICGDSRGGGNSARVVNEGHLRSVVDVVLHEYFNWNDGDEVDEGDIQEASVNLDFDFKTLVPIVNLMSALEGQTTSDSRQDQSTVQRGTRRLMNKYLLLMNRQESVNVFNDQSEATMTGQIKKPEIIEEKIVYRDYDDNFNMANNYNDDDDDNNNNNSNYNNNINNNNSNSNINNYNDSNNYNESSMNNYNISNYIRNDDIDKVLNEHRVENAFASKNVTSPVPRDPKMDDLDLDDGKQRRTNEATDSAHFRRSPDVIDDVDVTFNFDHRDLENVSGGTVVSSLAFDLSPDKPTGKRRALTSRTTSEVAATATTTTTTADNSIGDTSCKSCKNRDGRLLGHVPGSRRQLTNWLLGAVYRFVKHGTPQYHDDRGEVLDWPTFNSTNQMYLRADGNGSISLLHHLRSSQVALWTNLVPKLLRGDNEDYDSINEDDDDDDDDVGDDGDDDDDFKVNNGITRRRYTPDILVRCNTSDTDNNGDDNDDDSDDDNDDDSDVDNEQDQLEKLKKGEFVFMEGIQSNRTGEHSKHGNLEESISYGNDDDDDDDDDDSDDNGDSNDAGETVRSSRFIGDGHSVYSDTKIFKRIYKNASEENDNDYDDEDDDDDDGDDNDEGSFHAKQLKNVVKRWHVASERINQNGSVTVTNSYLATDVLSPLQSTTPQPRLLPSPPSFVVTQQRVTQNSLVLTRTVVKDGKAKSKATATKSASDTSDTASVRDDDKATQIYSGSRLMYEVSGRLGQHPPPADFHPLSPSTPETSLSTTTASLWSQLTDLNTLNYIAAFGCVLLAGNLLVFLYLCCRRDWFRFPFSISFRDGVERTTSVSVIDDAQIDKNESGKQLNSSFVRRPIWKKRKTRNNSETILNPDSFISLTMEKKIESQSTETCSRCFCEEEEEEDEGEGQSARGLEWKTQSSRPIKSDLSSEADFPTSAHRDRLIDDSMYLEHHHHHHRQQLQRPHQPLQRQATDEVSIAATAATDVGVVDDSGSREEGLIGRISPEETRRDPRLLQEADNLGFVLSPSCNLQMATPV